MAEVSIDGAYMAITVNAGIGGAVRLSFHDLGELMATLSYVRPGEVAKGIADTIGSRGEMTAQGASCFAMHPDEAVSLRLGKTSVWMGIEEADDLARSIRKALSWKEAHL